MRDKTVADAMTPLESVFMLDIAGSINRKLLKEVIYFIIILIIYYPFLMTCSLPGEVILVYPSTKDQKTIFVGYY